MPSMLCTPPYSSPRRAAARLLPLLLLSLLLAPTCRAQRAFARMQEPERSRYIPRPADLGASAAPTPGRISRLAPGWLERVRQTNRGRLLIYVGPFDCQYGVRELMQLDSLARRRPGQLRLMLVSADDWSLLGGIQDLYRDRGIEQHIYTLDMLAYDHRYRPDKRLQQFAAEVPDLRGSTVKLLLLQDDQIVYIGPDTARVATVPGLLR